MLKVISLPEAFVRHSLLFGVSYLLIQYILLLGQLAATYDIVLSERFKFRRADDLAAASQRVKENYEALQDANLEAAKDKTAALAKFRADTASKEASTLAAFQAAVSARQGVEASEQVNSEDRTVTLHNEHRARAAYILAKARVREAAREDAEKHLKLTDDPRVEAAATTLRESQADLDHLRREVPSSRRGYAAIERAIDTARLLTPAIIATVVLVGTLKGFG